MVSFLGADEILLPYILLPVPEPEAGLVQQHLPLALLAVHPHSLGGDGSHFVMKTSD